MRGADCVGGLAGVDPDTDPDPDPDPDSHPEPQAARNATMLIMSDRISMLPTDLYIGLSIR